MSSNAAETSPNDESQVAGAPNEVVSEPAPVVADSHGVADQSPSSGASSEGGVDSWSALPDSEVVSPAKKAAPRAEPEPSEEAVRGADAAAGDEGAPAGAVTPSESPTEAEELPPENKKKWYAIKVQSGREDTIKAAILRKIAIEGLEDVFSQIMIPVDKVIEKRAVKVKDKKTGDYTTQERKVERKVKKFQGYIFAELEFNDRLLYLIRETSGVGDFLKLRPRVNDTPLPEPMTDAEVKQMLGEKVGHETGGAKKVKIEFEKGDRVRIKEGSFKDSEGDVKDVILPKDPTDPPKVIVIVTFWGRPLDVELEYWQVAKV